MACRRSRPTTVRLPAWRVPRAAWGTAPRGHFANGLVYLTKSIGAGLVGLIPPSLLYFGLFVFLGVDISGPAYLMTVIGITTTTVLIWVEVVLSLRRHVPAPHPPERPWPTVSAIIAAYLPNEHATIMESLQAFAAIEYAGPRQVILAYNTPTDMPEVEARLRAFADAHPGFEVCRVAGSTSKAQNVNTALALVRGEVLGIFDADHHPAPDSFNRAVGWIIDGEADIVQGRCVVRNGEETWSSKLVAVEFEQIYGVAHPGRARMHGFGIFGGTNGYWRTSVLREITFDRSMLTEDIDSGLRALRAGYRLVSDPHLVSYELATTTFAGFWAQRMRWAQGWFQVSLRHTVPLIRLRSLTVQQRLGAAHLFFWRELYPWLALQMWPIIAFWAYRYTLTGIGWNVMPFIALTVLNLGTGPALVLVAWRRADPLVRPQWRWFAFAFVAAPFYSEVKNSICRIAQFKQLRGGQHEWVVTPRSSRAATAQSTSAVPATVGDAG